MGQGQAGGKTRPEGGLVFHRIASYFIVWPRNSSYRLVFHRVASYWINSAPTKAAKVTLKKKKLTEFKKPPEAGQQVALLPNSSVYHRVGGCSHSRGASVQRVARDCAEVAPRRACKMCFPRGASMVEAD